MIAMLQCSYSTVSSKELMAKVIPDYCIDSPVDCIFWERGTNDTYQVRCADARYSLRIYRHEIYPRDEIDFEVDALNYLHNNGFPAAFPIARKSGGYITEISAPEGIRYVLVTAYAEGESPEYDSLVDFRLTGESVAQLHQISQGFKTHHNKKDLDFKNFADDSFESIEPYVSHRPEDLAILKQYIEIARSSFQRVSEDEQTVVVRVIAGGPAEKSGQVSSGDRIVGVGNGKDGEIVDTVGWQLDDVADQIAGPKGSTVRLKILTGNANTPAGVPPKVVALVRDKINL